MSSSAHAGMLKLPTPKMAATKNTTAEAKAAAAKMHRRSRSGCFTCRLRRKKCEEGKPACKACRHLGLRCDYKRPMWWSNGEERRAQKESIKNAIKRTQVTKKTTSTQQSQAGATTPPQLCHSVPSVPTSADTYSDSTRAPSVDSPFETGYDFTHVSPDSYFQLPAPPQQMVAHPQFPTFSPYEIDVKTERSIFVNDVQTRKDSTISTFSTFQPPPAMDGQPAFLADSWVQQDYHESYTESFPEEPIDFNFFEFPHGQVTPTHETVIVVEDCDKYLLNHFLNKVIKLIFPILDVNQHGSARTDVVLPALEANKAYLHCCLSIAATHMKATEGLSGEQIDNDIVRHRYAAISELCEALNQDAHHAQILEATLGMIFFQCSVGRPDDALPDIPWHQHFQAATSLVNKLELQQSVVQQPHFDLVSHPAFNMTLASWIDILGATMLGRSPSFADTYRELNVKRGSAGLGELMGCDDRVMFYISEIACLEHQKAIGLDDNAVCKYVEILASEIRAGKPDNDGVETCFSPTGAIRPKQLRSNITAVFRLAARIYLCSLVPGFEPSSPAMGHLISSFCNLMNYIPEGPEGFDRSLAWPLLIAGANSTPATPFSAMFAERCAKLGEAADFGSFGRITELLRDVWRINDDAAARGDFRGVHWRNVMQQKGWDFLLI